LGGPNWSKQKTSEQEKLDIGKLYEPFKEIKMAANLNTEETAQAIRRYCLDTVSCEDK
jgi:hypothetical protein